MRALRLLDAIDWKLFFESTNHVESILRGDPAEVYPRMDFETCDAYRKVVEALAWGSDKTEQDVAELAIALARATPSDERRSHVGHYLIGEGRRALEQQLDYRAAGLERARRAVTGWPTLSYLLPLALLTLLPLLALGWYLDRSGAGPLSIALAVIVAAVPVSVLAVAVLQRALARLLPPRTLPKLDFSRGIPAEDRTLVVIPTLLGRAQDLDGLLRQIELHYLANPDPALGFALLTDDVDGETMPSSTALLERAEAEIAALNAKHGRAGSGPFHLLHREPRWNQSEQRFMGWERKRGKLGRAQPPAPGRQRHDLRPPRGRPGRPRRRPVRHHPRQRHAASDGGRAPPDRRPRAPAQSRGVRSPHRTVSSRGTRSSSRASRPLPRARARPGSHGSSRATSASTSTPTRSPSCIKTCSARGSTSARASTTSTHSRTASSIAHRRTRWSATICSRESTAGPRWPPTSSCSRTTRRATRPTPSGCIGGCAATGSSCRGSSPCALGAGRAAAQQARQHRPLEDPRQPSPEPDRPAPARAAGARLDAGCPPARGSGRRSRWSILLAPLLAALVAHRRRSRLATLARCGLALAFLAVRGRGGARRDRSRDRAGWQSPEGTCLQWTSAAHTAVGLEGKTSRAAVLARSCGRLRCSRLAVAAVLAVGPAVGARRRPRPFLLLWLAAPEIARWASQPVRARTETLRPDERARLRLLARRTWRFFDDLRRARTTSGCRSTTTRPSPTSRPPIGPRRPTSG